MRGVRRPREARQTMDVRLPPRRFPTGIGRDSDSLVAAAAGVSNILVANICVGIHGRARGRHSAAADLVRADLMISTDFAAPVAARSGLRVALGITALTGGPDHALVIDAGTSALEAGCDIRTQAVLDAAESDRGAPASVA